MRLLAVAVLLLTAGCTCGDDDDAPPSSCPEGCPRGETCVNGTCLPPVPCEILTCRPGDGCDNGVCVPADLCADVTCGDGQACQKGACVPADQDRDRDDFSAADDCDDTDPGVSPSADERCDAVDNDCDGAADEAGCEPEEYCCAAAGWGCTRIESDVANCGRCGNRCPEGQVCCEGLCADPASDPDHCGGCGRPCGGADGCLHAACEGGICIVTPEDCDDRRQCTDDRCDPTRGECQHFPDTERCGAQQECTADEGCVASPGCDAGCGDGFACTEDLCDDAQGRCVHEPLDDRCDDGDLCTVDHCAVGLGCLHDAIACEDGDACTLDHCDPLLGCTADVGVEDCWNGLDDDCDGLVDCGVDPDCNGLSRAISGGTACTCSTEPLGACGPSEPCAACVLGPEGPRVCMRVDGGWEWTAPADPTDIGLCDRRCAVQCACESEEIFRCDGERWVRVLEGDDTCSIDDSDRCAPIDVQ